MKKLRPLVLMFAAVLAGAIVVTQAHHAAADTTTLTVNSTADTQDAIPGDGVCATVYGGSECTLRAAIEEANAVPGAATIAFAVTPDANGAAVIMPQSQLPVITDQLTINGYTQVGAMPNSAVSPAPFNGTIAVELDGSQAGDWSAGLVMAGQNANGSRISGLTIHSFKGHGISLTNTNYVTVAGNYIGTSRDGLTARGNGLIIQNGSGMGSAIDARHSAYLTIGGSGPADRNVLAHSVSNDIFVGNEENDANAATNLVLKGNYIGMGADGVTGMPAGRSGGIANGILMGNVHAVTIGGLQSGDTNVFAASSEYGISFRDGSSDAVVAGNYVGTNYTGADVVHHYLGTGNPSSGISVAIISSGGFTRPSHDILIDHNIVSGNTHTAHTYGEHGIFIHDGAYNVTMRGNKIGADASGTQAVPNGKYGIDISTCTVNTIGGTTPADRNIIAGNGTQGINVHNDNGQTCASDPLSIVGNYIGLGETGQALPNGGDGIAVSGTVPGVQIGSTDSGGRNIISANTGYGVRIQASGITVMGNYISTNPTGQSAQPNLGGGIYVNGTQNMLGGSVVGAGNLVSGNQQTAVEVQGDSNTVAGNTIGATADGQGALPNTGVGLKVVGNANTIGGSSVLARNIISGNGSHGLCLIGNNNSVQANYIGTDASGNQAIANAGWGLQVSGMGNLIGGATPAMRNLISGNQIGGVNSTSGSNTLQGNYIGTNAAGTQALANGGAGVVITGDSAVVGGATPAMRNLISGNQGDGLRVQGNNATIQANYIGLNAAGTGALPNGSIGVNLAGNNALIGGPSPVMRNLISGNSGDGLRLQGNNATIQSNYIGTDVTGTVARGNQAGAVVMGIGNAVGGCTTGLGNVIAANPQGGLVLEAGSANTVQLNFIGTDYKGSAPLGNGLGLFVHNSSNNLIGGATSACRNVINANTQAGVVILGDSDGASNNNQVLANYIGKTTRPEVVPALGNNGAGLLLMGDATGNQIGNTNTSTGNFFAANHGPGVLVVEMPLINKYPMNNPILNSQFAANDGIGIDHAVDSNGDYLPDAYLGATANNTAGLRDLLNTPIVTAASFNGGNVTITYDFSPNLAAPYKQYRLDFYAADGAGNFGRIRIGSATVKTAVTGQTVTLNLPAGYNLTHVSATATLFNTATVYGSTSEFASNVPIGGLPVGW